MDLLILYLANEAWTRLQALSGAKNVLEDVHVGSI